jgi:hypothetical protein
MDGVGFLPGRGVRKAASDGSGAQQQCEVRARLAMDALKRRMTREAMLLLSAPPLPAPAIEFSICSCTGTTEFCDTKHKHPRFFNKRTAAQ